MANQLSFNFIGSDAIQMDKNPGIRSATTYVRDSYNDKAILF
jgi:hypothetical protein